MVTDLVDFRVPSVGRICFGEGREAFDNVREGIESLVSSLGDAEITFADVLAGFDASASALAELVWPLPLEADVPRDERRLPGTCCVFLFSNGV